MKQITILLYLTIICTLATATVLEHIYGTSFIEQKAYNTAWFFTLWLLMGITSLFVFIKKKIWRKISTALFHLSFLIILTGAATTFITGIKGYMHLTVGKEINHFTDMEQKKRHRLPFTMQLDSFVIKYYNGTEVPSDYITHVTIDDTSHTISMNNILVKDGYRFYQSSYDDNLNGSWLSVSYDPWGNLITYSGYILLASATCILLFSKRESFRKLLKHPSLKKGTILTLFIIISHSNMQAEGLNVVNKNTADSLAHIQVLYKGRIAPFDTQARDFLKKLYGRENYKGLNAVQVITSWQLTPQEWYKQPIIKIKDKTLRKKLGADEEFVSLSQLYDENNEYKLQQILNETKNSGKHSPVTKAILETDEKAGMILMLHKETLIKKVSDESNVQPLSRVAIETEIIYNSIPFIKILFMTNLTLGFIAFFLLLTTTVRGNNKTTNLIRNILKKLLYLSTATLAINYAMRWYISERIPLSNGFETMTFLALAILIISCIMAKRFSFVIVGGFLLSGFTLLVAHLGEMNPQITPLMPVLVSPLLSIHVSLIMISYALFTFIMLNGIVSLAMMRKKDEETDKRIESVTILSRLLLYPAVLFLGIGIFIGAVWANVSWGRYWAWDPKEVWALITFMIYGAAFHTRSIVLFRNKRFFHIYMIIAFFAVLFTYFGVNYLLGGMHSYANG